MTRSGKRSRRRQEPGRRRDGDEGGAQRRRRPWGAGRTRPRPRSGQNPKEDNDPGDEADNKTGRERAQRARQLAACHGNTKKNHSAENKAKDWTSNDPGDTKGERRSPESS